MSITQQLYLAAERVADLREGTQPRIPWIDSICCRQRLVIQTALFWLRHGEPDKARLELEKV